MLSLRTLRGVGARVPASRMLLRASYATQPNPKEKAEAIVQALPASSMLTKSATLATGVAGGIWAVSNSLYVLNAETCLLGCFIAFFTIVAKTVAPSYKQWAEDHVAHIKNTLNAAREQHVVAVQDRIDTVNKLGDVVGTTKDLFAAAKDTVRLEAQAFELKQRVDLAAEAKNVLDSWVRYESQLRQREQEELAQAVIAKVDKEIASDKFQADFLKQAVASIEKTLKN